MGYKVNATSKVYDFICKKLKEGEWQPGDKIWTEEELCRQLEVSRVAVRQAIGEFVTQGRLERKQGSGTFVTEKMPVSIITAPGYVFNKQELKDIITFRIGFETENLKLFMKKATFKDIACLEETLENMKNNRSRQDEFCRNDYLFHKIIADGTNNKFIRQINKLLNDVLESQQREINNIVGYDVGLEFHELILKYIKNNDEELAVLFMRRHLQAVADALEKHFEEVDRKNNSRDKKIQ